MAYSDYGAFVYKNGQRRTDKEDAPLFASDEEAFGESIDNIPSSLRIFANILHTRDSYMDENLTSEYKRLNYIQNHIAHGVMGDGTIRVRCYKQGLPTIWEITEEGLKEVEYPCDDPFDYESVHFNYKDYRFTFNCGSPYEAIMVDDAGNYWRCEYDYEFGAGFES